MTEKIFIFKNAQIAYSTNQAVVSNKPTIFCLHGFLENKFIFNFLFKDSFFLKFNIVSIDLLGHGASDSIGYVHSMEEQALMVNELKRFLNLSKISLLGHSMGGYVALAFLELFPESVSQIYLINSTAKADSESKKQNRLRGIELVKKNTALFIQLAIANLFDAETKVKNEAEIDELKQIALTNKTQGIIANMQGMLQRKDRQFLLKECPQIYYISGSKDAIVLIEDAKTEVLNTRVHFNEIEGYHMLWLEKPQVIKKILKETL